MLGHGRVGYFGQVLGNLRHHHGPYLRGEGRPQIPKGRRRSENDEAIVGPIAPCIRKCIGQSVREVPLQLPVRIGMGLDSRADRSRGVKGTARSVRHEFVGGRMRARAPSAIGIQVRVGFMSMLRSWLLCPKGREMGG